MSSEIWGIVVGIVLTAGTGLFVASEFALVNLDRPDLEQRQARGERRLGSTIGALKVTATHLSSAQLGITLTTLLAGFTFEPAISSLLKGPLTSVGIPGGLVSPVGAVLAIVLATLFSMIFGELVPKNFALAVPVATAKLVVPFQVAFTFIFRPVISLLNGTANRIIRSLGIEPKEELSGARSAEELGFLIRRSADQGTLDADNATMLHRTLTFSARTASEVMTPRVRMTSLPQSANAEEVIDASVRTGHSRFPVLGRNVDEVVGVVHVKSAYSVDFGARAQTNVTDFTTEPLRVPETASAASLLDLLRGRGYQVAVVVDEYGGTAGIVTLEDLVEELLGEVQDEHDRHVSDVVKHRDSTVLSGRLRPDEAWERARVRIPEDDEYDTIAGFVLDTLNRIPKLGEEIPIEQGTLRVERLTGARIERLRFLPAPQDGPAESAETTSMKEADK